MSRRLPALLPLAAAALLSAASPTARAEGPPAGTVQFGAKGFTLADASGDNVLNLGLRFQPRFVLKMAGDPDAPESTALTGSGFQVRRMLFKAFGKVAKRVEFRFRIDASRVLPVVDGTGATQVVQRPILDDAQVNIKVADAFQVAFGQFKTPFGVQQLADDATLLMPETSVANEGLSYGTVALKGFSWSRDVGLMVHGTAPEGRFGYQVGLFSGDGANRWPRADNGFLYVGRVVVAPRGAIGADEMDLKRAEPRIAVGFNGGVNDVPVYDADGARDGSKDDVRLGGDLRFAARGFTFAFESFGGIDADSSSSGGDPVTRWGLYAQAGHYIQPAHLLPAVRFSRLDPNTDSAVTGDAVYAIEAAVHAFLPDPGKKDAGGDLGNGGKFFASYGVFLQEEADHPLLHQFTLGGQVDF